MDHLKRPRTPPAMVTTIPPKAAAICAQDTTKVIESNSTSLAYPFTSAQKLKRPTHLGGPLAREIGRCNKNYWQISGIRS